MRAHTACAARLALVIVTAVLAAPAAALGAQQTHDPRAEIIARRVAASGLTPSAAPQSASVPQAPPPRRAAPAPAAASAPAPVRAPRPAAARPTSARSSERRETTPGPLAVAARVGLADVSRAAMTQATVATTATPAPASAPAPTTSAHATDSAAAGASASPAVPTAASADSTRPAPGAPPRDAAIPLPPRVRAWYDKLSLRGYAQVRYNRLMETNPDLVCQQCDRSIGRNNGIAVRRGRLVISGDVHPRLSIYIQPDFANETGGQQFYLQLRDVYFDVFLDSAKTTRVRVGQSKVPFGYENLQSSSNRVPLDRNDALNSGLPNERDLGVFLYWAPTTARQRFKLLADSGLKGSGDYGVLGAGVYNGQTANRAEQNDHQHVVARASYPFRLAGGQFVEVGAQAYRGRFVVPSSQLTAGVKAPREFDDRRAAATLVVYPQPIGLTAEWNVGRGPAFDSTSRTLREGRLSGGFAMLTYRAQSHGQVVIPFVRAQRYDGGKKLETDARFHRVREVDLGVEWLPFSAFELTAAYVVSDRATRDAAALDAHQRGRLLRLQAQFNY